MYEFLLAHAYRLVFSPAVEGTMRETCAVNPKRMQREARRQMLSPAVGTKAQQVLKLQHEQAVESRQARRQKRREELAQRRFDLRQDRRREKRRGH